MSSIDRHGERWRARWRTPDGKSRSKVFDRKEDARRYLASLDHSKLAGAYIDPALGRVTFREYAEEWRKVQPHRASSAIAAETRLRLHIYPVIGERPLAAIRPSEIQALVHSLNEELSPQSAKGVYQVMAAVFNAAVRDRVLGRSPHEGVRLLRVPRSQVIAPTTEQVMAIADGVNVRYRAAVLVGAGTGLRIGELFGLTLDRVDFLRKTARVDRQLVVPQYGGGFGPLKTPASYRTVSLGETTVETLARHLEQFPAVDGLIFTNKSGTSARRRFEELWRKARRTGAFPMWLTPHHLRHYYASLLIARGASVKVVQSLLGHSSATITLDTYGHLWPDSDDLARGIVDLELGSRVTIVSREGSGGVE